MIKQAYKNLIFTFTVLFTAVFGFIFSSNSASAAWTINANNVTVSYVAIPNTSTSTINVSGNWTTSAAFTAGSNNTVTFNDTGAQTITGATTWNNLIINNTSDPANDTNDVDPAAVQTVAGTLTVTDGQWSPFTDDDYVNLSIGANGIIKPDAGITVSGEWTNDGTFTHNSSTVTFDGAGGSTQYIFGNTTFNNFTATTSSARTILSEIDSTQTVSGTWTITGASGQLITLGVSPACGSATSVTFNYKGSSVTYGTVSVSGQCFMDRNLGASQAATAYNDTDSYGDYFQWGRLDDLHQNSGSGTTTTLSSGSDPGHGNFIYGMSSSPWDWVSPQIDTLWQSPSYVNNPCPSGWHVPSHSEWSTAMTDLGLASCSSDCLNSMANSSLKLPTVGHRSLNDAALSGQGTSGYYWSSSPTSSNAYYLYFSSSEVKPVNADRRAYGFSARCLKN